MRSSSLPELQCFISDSQLTRDAALHLGLGDMEEPVVTLAEAGVCPWVMPWQGCVSACLAGAGKEVFPLQSHMPMSPMPSSNSMTGQTWA